MLVEMMELLELTRAAGDGADVSTKIWVISFFGCSSRYHFQYLIQSIPFIEFNRQFLFRFCRPRVHFLEPMRVGNTTWV